MTQAQGRRRTMGSTEAVAMTVMVVGLLSAAPARSQIPMVPEPQPANQQIACGAFGNPATELTTLRDHYLEGRWVALIRDTRALLAKCEFKAETSDAELFPGKKPNFTRDWYLVVLATTDTNDEPLTLRYVVHEPTPYPYSTTVLDVPLAKPDAKGAPDTAATTSRLVQIFLAPHNAISLDTRIQATETPNPITEQIGDVAKAIFDPSVVVPLLKGVITPASKGGAAAPVKLPPAPVLATVSRVHMPFRRGDYKYSDVMRTEGVLDGDKNLLLRKKFEGLSEAAAKAAAAAVKEAVPDAAMLTNDAALSAALASSASAYLLGPTSEGIADCARATYKSSCWTGLAEALRLSRETFCLDDTAKAYCQSERDDLMFIHFKDVAAAPKAVTTATSATISAMPSQRLSFGVISVYVLGAKSSRDRVKVDGGKLTADPLGRSMTAVVVNLHSRFNPKAPAMETAEKLRTFIGVAVTPNIGVTLGTGYGFTRSLSVNIGYALLVTPALRADDKLGSEPGNGTRPFAPGATHAAFLGLGYKFGK